MSSKRLRVAVRPRPKGPLANVGDVLIVAADFSTRHTDHQRSATQLMARASAVSASGNMRVRRKVEAVLASYGRDGTISRSDVNVEWGAFFFGTVIGWFTYYVNRYRSTVVLGDVAAIIAAVGGGAVLALFPQGTALFSAYGVGLAVGFFGYLVVLVVIVVVLHGKGWSLAWFLDGRRPRLSQEEMDGPPGSRAMGEVTTIRR